MNNEATVLDASAVLSVLNQERGHEAVEILLAEAMISAVNFSEVITVLTSTGIPPDVANELTHGMLRNIIPFDQEQAYMAACLRKQSKQYGLSLGDRACLALAKLQNLPAVTADKIWGKLHIPGIKIHVIR